MIALAGIMAAHPRAVERDIIHEGYRMSDIGNALTLSEFASIILAAPRDSAVRWAVDGGWSPEAHLLANAQEQRAGLLNLQGRYPRPGVAELTEEQAAEALTPADIPRDAFGNVHLDAYPADEFFARRQAAYKANAERAAS